MKKTFRKFFYAVICVLYARNAFSARIDSIPSANMKTKLFLTDGTILTGRTIATTDSSITIQPSHGYAYWNQGPVTVPVEQLRKINFRDKSKTSVGENMLIGAAGGFLIGLLLGVNECDDSYNDECTWFESIFANSSWKNAVKIGAGFSVVGLGFGILTGDKVKLRLRIGGDRRKFSQERMKFSKY